MVAATEGWQKSSKTRSAKRTSDKALARDIAESIRAHVAAGVIRAASDYSSRLEIIEAVETLLSK